MLKRAQNDEIKLNFMRKIRVLFNYFYIYQRTRLIFNKKSVVPIISSKAQLEFGLLKLAPGHKFKRIKVCFVVLMMIVNGLMNVPRDFCWRLYHLARMYPENEQKILTKTFYLKKRAFGPFKMKLKIK